MSLAKVRELIFLTRAREKQKGFSGKFFVCWTLRESIGKPEVFAFEHRFDFVGPSARVKAGVSAAIDVSQRAPASTKTHFLALTAHPQLTGPPKRKG
jgi:FtsP/CotA-like multicopper oxidase with cupredoxin domain